MQVLSKISLKLVAIIVLISFLCLASIQQANSQNLIDPRIIAPEITRRVQADLQSTIQKATEPYTTQVNVYLDKIDGYQRQLYTYQEELNKIPDTIKGQVDLSVSGVTKQVQDEINNITRQVQGKIDELQNQVNAAITRSIRTLTWGMLGIDGLATAVITWFVVRRVTRQLKKQVFELNQTIQGLQSQIEQSVASISNQVRDQIDDLPSATLKSSEEERSTSL